MKLLVIFVFWALVYVVFSALLTQDEFNRAVTINGYPQPSWVQYNYFTNSVEEGANIHTKEEAAMALAQFIYETKGLQYKRELKCLNNGGCPNQYKTPSCDKNDQKYFGRGYIQLSWCDNYKEASIDLYGNDWLIYEADAVAQEENIAWLTAFWFWKKYVHKLDGVQQGKFGVTTRAINGDLECDGTYQYLARERYQVYIMVREALYLPGNGDERGCYN